MVADCVGHGARVWFSLVQTEAAPRLLGETLRLRGRQQLPVCVCLCVCVCVCVCTYIMYTGYSAELVRDLPPPYLTLMQHLQVPKLRP